MDNPFRETPCSLRIATSVLIRELDQRGFTVLPEYREPDLPGLHQELLRIVDLTTEKWLRTLASQEPEPQWHVVLFSPEWIVDSEDHIVATKSIEHGLGYVLNMMHGLEETPSRFFWNDRQELIIQGQQGEVLAKLFKVRFEHITQDQVRRAQSALRGLQNDAPGAWILKRLQKIRGFPHDANVLSHTEWMVDGEEDFDFERPVPMVEPTPSNLATVFLKTLNPMLSKPIPRHLALALCAHYFGFESWNHFTGRVKQRGEALYLPFAIFEVSDHEPDWEKPCQFFMGLPSALCGFSESLLSQSQRTLFFNPGWHLSVTNRTRVKRRDYVGRGHQFIEGSGIVLKELWVVEPEEKYIPEAKRYLQAVSKV